MADYHTEGTKKLFKVIAALQTPEDVKSFFEDICTIKELQDMGQRLEAALLLNEGWSYQKISEQVGISPATISRVSRCLHYGSGGYEAAIKKIYEMGDEAEE